ncbi:hypothetical protein LTR22_000050 [Elasticomyces elasticus]|nr:hypothetical protein LTR22_000050 [Elasticomyces elasticus]
MEETHEILADCFAVANTPQELTHLLEEISAKDQTIASFQTEISKRDAQLQKWVRTNGGHIPNTKEEAFAKTINDCYDQCEVLQAEKVGLSEKALVVLERQVRRLDVGLRKLAAREEFPADWNGPSLLGSGTATGVSTPVLQTISGNAGPGGAGIANAAQLRMATAARQQGSVPAVAAQLARSQREGSTDSKRRRLNNPNIGSSLPNTSSNLRQSSIGPQGTPVKSGTPVPSATNNTSSNTLAVATSGQSTSHSRAGSAQPNTRPVAGTNKKAGAPSSSSQPTKRLAPPGARKRVRPSGGGHHKKGDRRRTLARDRADRATPSTNASEAGSGDSASPSASPTPSTLPKSQNDGISDPATHAPTTSTSTKRSHHGRRPAAPIEPEDEGEGDVEDEDDGVYCYCQKGAEGGVVVSYLSGVG